MKLELQKGSRTKVLAYGLLIAMIIFAIRLFYIQIVQHDYYKELASSEQVKRLKIPAQRGIIYVMDGSRPTKIVMNESVYTVFADPKIVDEPDKAARVIRDVAKDKVRDGLDKLLTIPGSRYQVLANKLTRAEADKIKNENLKGIGFQEMSQRVYTEGTMAAQILGFVDFEGEGKYGIEGGLNSRLVGTDGLLQSVTDIKDVPLTIGNQNIKIAKKDGDNLVLSIDRNIQSRVESALADGLKRSGAQKGSVVVMDPDTGMVKAMANLPSYDPAKFNLVTDAGLFNNPTISFMYEPGSVSKSFTFAKALDTGTITPETTYNNTDYQTIDDRTITNATKGKTGIISMQTVYNWSLNTGTIEIMKMFGGGSITRDARQKLYSFLHDNLGFGQKTEIELDGELSGTIISPDEREGNAVRYANMSFGQGYDATMIQVAAAYCAVINGGNYYKPTILAGTIDASDNFNQETPKLKKSGIVSSATSATLREMAAKGRSQMFKVNDKPGYQIGGKTGTSQVAENGHYKDNETIGSYIGFGGADKPKYVIMVMVSGKNQALGGSKDAMPIFNDISGWLIDYLKIKPKG